MNAFELFAGAGGLGLGFSRAGFNHIAVIENDAWACETLEQNTDWPVKHMDVSTVDYSSIKENVDILTGGPPCQPFSFAGKHQAHLDNRDMFPEAIRAVRELKPCAFLFENVKGILRSKFSNYLEYVRLQLRHPELILKNNESWQCHCSRLQRHEVSGSREGLNYNIVLQVLNAADFGVPQKRDRLFIAGFREDLGIKWSFPIATHSYDSLLYSQWVCSEYWDRHMLSKEKRPINGRGKSRAFSLKRKPKLLPWRTVRDALTDLPDPEFQLKLTSRFSDHTFIPGARSYKGHTGSPYDLPSKTLKAGVHGVPGGENMLLRDDLSVRYFTVRECARIQGFEDDFIFHGSWGRIMKQLGNAVPVGLAECIANSLHEALSYD